MQSLIRLMLAAVWLLCLAHCGYSSAPASVDPASGNPLPATLRYDVTVTRTTMGIPHIKAADFASMGYGYGYAFAEDNLCVMQEDFITIRGERSKYMGASGSYTIQPNGVTADNLTSDFFWKFAATDAAIAPLKNNTRQDYRDATRGFADGYNRYMAELKTGQHPGRHADCAGKAWLLPITEDDMYRRYLRLSLIASSSVFINEIVNAAPSLTGTGASSPTAAQKIAALQSSPVNPLQVLRSHLHFGSNMYALGKDATASGTPMLLGNPHFPWIGTERLYLTHLSIPSKNFDVMGGSLYGVPAVNIGFNDHFAWSHTVSTAFRFTFYELTLNPADPTQYLYNGSFVPMMAVPVTIDVLGSDGTLTQQTRTLYRSQYGPMLVLTASGVPVLGWNRVKAYTLRDANAENDRLINQFAAWNSAQSLDEFIGLHKSILGIPWVNTTATGPGGKAYYGDVSVVPNVPDSEVQTCAAHPIHDVVQQLDAGLPVLDGSRTDCQWQTDADAPAPGIFGGSHLPTLQRDDYVKNSNDSYWLTNPAAPLTGYNKIIGCESCDIGLRPRLAILQVQRRLAGSDGLPGNKFDLPILQKVALSSRIYSAELARDTVVNTQCALPTVVSSSGPVSTATACAALKSWDMAANLDSKGEHLWREFWRNAIGSGLPVVGYPAGFWTTPFSSGDPVNTPSGLDVALPTIQKAFGDAINTVTASGFAFDAPFGTIQHPCCIDPAIPIFGGEDSEGAFTVVDDTNTLDKNGYRVSFGNSYIQTVTWDQKGVVAQGFVTYSESTDPASPHFSDFTHQYSAKQWQPFPFHDDEIAAQKISEQHLTQ
jgi:acyl-homoserine-lactone acylase